MRHAASVLNSPEFSIEKADVVVLVMVGSNLPP
jgi:hypothetical protein